MAANTDPIFSKQGNLSQNASTTMNQAITAAANDFTGAGANNSLVFTAGSNGALLRSLRIKAAGTNVASVLRIFINNGSTPGTASNNTFFGEIPLPATTANAAGVTGPDMDYPMNIALDPSFRVYVGLGTAVSGGWVVTPNGGQY